MTRSTRTRTDGHAQATRGARIETPEETLTETTSETTSETPEAIAQAKAERIEALASILKDADATEALNGYVLAHMSGDYARLLRSLVRTLPHDVRNRGLFTRKRNADGSVISYDLCGYTGNVVRDASGRFRQDGFEMHASDKSGNTFRKTFGDGTSTYDNVTTPEKNMLAGWRNGVIWILNERETERVSHSQADAKALAEAERKLADAEKRASEAEAKLANTQSTDALMQALQALTERLAIAEAKADAK